MDSSYLKWDSTHVSPLLWATKGNLSLFDVLKLSSVRFELCYNQIRKNSLDVTFVFLSITATFFTLNNSQILNKIAGYRIRVLVSTTVNGPMPDVCHRCTINTEFYFRNFVNSLLKITIYAKSINYSAWISGCHISTIIKIDTAFIKRWTQMLMTFNEVDLTTICGIAVTLYFMRTNTASFNLSIASETLCELVNDVTAPCLVTELLPS